MNCNRPGRICLRFSNHWLSRIALGLTLWACWVDRAPAFQPTVVPQELLAALEDALDERTADFQERLDLVQRIDALIPNSVGQESRDQPNRLSTEELLEVWLKTRFVEAVANMRLERFDESSAQIEALRQRIDPQTYPVLWFRCRSVRAAIMFLQGNVQSSLEAHEELLASDVQGIPDSLIERARTNYAAALNEIGRLHEAAELYETVMLNALERQNDIAALHAGNNLIALLIKNANAPAARHTLVALTPALQRNSTIPAAASVRLKELELLRLEGKWEQAIQGAMEFIQQSDAPSPQLLGTAHRLLAQTLMDTERFDEALVHAQNSVDLLDHMKTEIVEARITLAQVLTRQCQYQAALDALAHIDLSREAVPSRLKRISQLKLNALLRLDGREEECKLLDSFLAANSTQESLYAKNVTEYLESKLLAVRQKLSAQQSEAQQRVAAAEQAISRRSRYLVLGLASISCLSGCLLFYLDNKRRTGHRRLAEQRLQNEKLEALVESKTRELTANLQSQAELSQALERKKRIETIGLLAGNVAHDVNNLLQVIANANEVLASEAANDEQRAQTLRISNESIQHGAGIIRQLLAYSRQQELTARLLRVQEYLNDSLPLFRSALGDRIEFALEDRSADSYLCVDSSRLTTSILNVLNNSADAMPNGGNVWLIVKPTQINSHRDSLSQLSPGNYLSFSIRDTGCGMDVEQLSRAFEPFYSTKCVGQGTGLGLSSVQSFVRQSKGDVRLHSTPCIGTVVEILLPLAAPPTAQPSPVQTPPTNVLADKRLLLVEDHEAAAKSMMFLLSHLKVNATLVRTGDDAIKLLEHDAGFDFVLSDIHMPGTVDGTALVRWLQSTHPELTIFLMSGYHETRPEEIKVPFLQKPFNVGQLADLLTNHCG